MAGFCAESFEFRQTGFQLMVKLRHIGVRRVGRDIRRDAVHANLRLPEVFEDRIQIAETHAQMRFDLPPAGIVTFQVCSAEHFYRESEPVHSV